MKTVRKAQIENQHKISTLANPSPKCSAQTKGRHRVTMTTYGGSGEGGTLHGDFCNALSLKELGE